MKNSTLSRKPGHDMKKNVGYQPARTRADQSGDGADFAFNGQMGDGVNRSSTTARYSHNQHGGSAGGNYGIGPRVGNASSNPKGTPLTIARASQGGKISGGASAECPANADKIYMGLGPRKGNE